MILAIIGTHGAGKSTLVSDISRRYTEVEPFFESDKAQPVWMRCSVPGVRPLIIIGSYAPGRFSGPDSGRFSGRIPEIYEWIHQHHQQGCHVLLEGVIVAGTIRRAIELATEGLPVYVLAITEPLEVCVAGVQARKAERRAGHKRSKLPLNVDVIQGKAADTLRAVERCRAAGVPVSADTRAGLLARALTLLEMPADQPVRVDTTRPLHQGALPLFDELR